MIKCVAFQPGGFLMLCQASAEARGMSPPCLGMFGFPTVWRASALSMLRCTSCWEKRLQPASCSRNAHWPIRGRAFSLVPSSWFREIQRGNESLTFRGCAGISWPDLSCIKVTTICKCHVQFTHLNPSPAPMSKRQRPSSQNKMSFPPPWLGSLLGPVTGNSHLIITVPLKLKKNQQGLEGTDWPMDQGERHQGGVCRG